jgi:cytochrome c peroxidase
MFSKKEIYIFLITASIIGVGLVLTSCKPEPKPCESIGATPYVWEKPFRFPDMNIPADNPMTIEGIELGRFLFYDSTLSKNSVQSCGTCHKPEFGFSDIGNVKSFNANGILTKRNTPALLNAGYQNKYFFDGRSATLEESIIDATDHELFTDWTNNVNYLKNDTFYANMFEKAFGCDAVTKENIVKAMAQFIRTIVSSGNSEIDTKFFRTNNYTLLNPAAARGFQIFTSERSDCFHCHFTNILTTDNLFHNNGVQNSGGTFNFSDNGRGTITAVQTDNAKMKTPTLRNIALTPPYMHNGQFNTLREVVDFYADSVHLSPTLDANMLHSGNIRLNLTNSERDDLIAFLETMTDTFVINNPKYRSPFK